MTPKARCSSKYQCDRLRRRRSRALWGNRAFLSSLGGGKGNGRGAEAFAMLAIALLAVAGAYTLGAAALAFATA